nr:hypothetical protein [uncultured Fluviicola sp.]
MMKYILFFIAAYFGGNSNVLAQSQASTKQGESAVVSDTLPKSEISRGTITRAGKNQQSVYTPAAEPIQLNQESGSTLAVPAKAQPAIIDPKKK